VTELLLRMGTESPIHGSGYPLQGVDACLMEYLPSNSRITDSQDAAKSAELRLLCKPRPAACALTPGPGSGSMTYVG
jgi:hypothetical protein